MSVESDNGMIPQEVAAQEAEKTLRFEIGNLPHLGTPERTDGEYVFPIQIRVPRVIFDENQEDPIDVRFMSSEEIGEIRVDGTSGEVVDRTKIPTIERRIRNKKKQVDEAVQKALVKASAQKFSLLPFPEHRYAPIQDLLAEVILNGQITVERLDSLGNKERNKYERYIETLSEIGLLRWEDGRITANDHLIEIEAQTGRPSKALEGALAHFFEQGANNLDMIRSILKPYLTIAGYYYRRSLEMDNLPRIPERQFRQEIESAYTGQQGRQKSFKVSRYLLQLEEVGILLSESENGNRAWVGSQDVRSKLLQQREELDTIAEVIA